MIDFKKATETLQQFFNPTLWFTKKLLEFREEELGIYKEVSEAQTERIEGLKRLEQAQDNYIEGLEKLTKILKFKLLSLLVEKNSISQEVSDYIRDLESTGTLLIGSHLSPVKDAEDLRVNQRIKQRIFEILKDSFGVLEDLPGSEFVKLTGTKENFLDLVIFLLPEFESYYFIILDREITLV